jgi:hypothetical protein
MADKITVFDDPNHLPGLTLHQPYAGAVLLWAQGFAGKSIETRKHRFLHVGADVVICAGVSVLDADMMRLHREIVRRGPVPEAAFDAAMSLSGVAVALTQVVECRPLTVGDYSRSLWWNEEENARASRWAWVLGAPRVLKPFPWR